MILWLALLVVGANAQSCKVSLWSDWGECTRITPCQSKNPGTWHTTYTAGPYMDQGRRNMLETMRLKDQLMEEKYACKMSGACPEYWPPMKVTARVNCTNGMAGAYPCGNVDLLAHMNQSALGYENPVSGDNGYAGNDIWGWTDPLNGDEYAIVGLTGGTSFVRITDPENPKTVGFLYTTNNRASTWRDIKVIDNTAYIVSEASGHGLQVFDLELLRTRDGSNIITSVTAHMSTFGNAHNIVSNVASKTLFVVGANVCSGGLYMIDVSSRLNPVNSGCYSADGYTHDAECIIYQGPHSAYNGSEICFAYNENTLTIVDVTTKSSPSLISRTSYTGFQYTHQGWITEDHTTVLMDDELDEQRSVDDTQQTRTLIWDVTNLASPQRVANHMSSKTVIDHNQYIMGDLSYQSNYEAGLRIMRIDTSTYTLGEVGYFDVFPSADTAQFRGSWSNYPYFPSGVVAISSIEYGLFVVRPNIAAMEATYLAINKAQQVRTRKVISRENVKDSCPAISEWRECTPSKC